MARTIVDGESVASIEEAYVRAVGRGTPALRASTVRNYWKCPRKFFFSSFLRIQQPHEIASRARDIGTYFHLIAEQAYYHLLDIEKAVEEARKQNELDIAALENLAEQIESPDAQDRCLKAVESTRRSFPVAEVMARLWWYKYPPSYNIADVRLVEKDLSMVWRGIRIEGRPDVAIKMTHPTTTQSVLFLHDFKTTSRKPSHAFVGRAYSVANTLYTLLAQHAFPDENVAGCIYHAVQQPTIRLRIKDTFQDYLDRVRQWYIDSADEPPMQSSLFFRDSQAEKDAYVLILPLREALVCLQGCNLADALSLFPRSEQSCVTYDQVCPYYAFCGCTQTVWKSSCEKFVYAPIEEKEESDGDSNASE